MARLFLSSDVLFCDVADFRIPRGVQKTLQASSLKRISGKRKSWADGATARHYSVEKVRYFTAQFFFHLISTYLNLINENIFGGRRHAGRYSMSFSEEKQIPQQIG